MAHLSAELLDMIFDCYVLHPDSGSEGHVSIADTWDGRPIVGVTSLKQLRLVNKTFAAQAAPFLFRCLKIDSRPFMHGSRHTEITKSYAFLNTICKSVHRLELVNPEDVFLGGYVAEEEGRAKLAAQVAHFWHTMASILVSLAPSMFQLHTLDVCLLTPCARSSTPDRQPNSDCSRILKLCIRTVRAIADKLPHQLLNLHCHSGMLQWLLTYREDAPIEPNQNGISLSTGHGPETVVQSEIYTHWLKPEEISQSISGIRILYLCDCRDVFSWESVYRDTFKSLSSFSIARTGWTRAEFRAILREMPSTIEHVNFETGIGELLRVGSAPEADSNDDMVPEIELPSLTRVRVRLYTCYGDRDGLGAKFTWNSHVHPRSKLMELWRLDRFDEWDYISQKALDEYEEARRSDWGLRVG